MTKADLVSKGKTLGLDLKMSSKKEELESAVAAAEKKNGAKSSPRGRSGEK